MGEDGSREASPQTKTGGRPSKILTAPSGKTVHPKALQAKTAKDRSSDGHQRLGRIRQWTTSFIICVSFLIMGTSVGWASPVLYEIRNTGVPMNLTTTDISIMVSLFYVGNIAMPIPGGMLSDRVGRKNSLLVMTVVPLISWVVIYLATSPVMLHIARVLAGAWSGMILTVVPFYIGETVEPGIRGRMGAMMQLLTNAGIFIAYVIGPRFSYWTMAIIFGSIPIIYFAMLLYVPESPYWLIYKGKDIKAAKSLVWIRGLKREEDAERELFQLTEEMYSDILKPSSLKNLCQSKGQRVALIIVEVLAASQRLSGISAVMAYSATTLPDADIGFLTPNDCVTIMSISWFIGEILAIFLVDKAGRRLLMVISSAGSGAAMLGASLWYYFNQDPKKYFAVWLPFVLFFIYGFFFNVGLGPIPGVVQGEMFPPQYKAIASAFTAIVLSATSTIINFSFPHIALHFGMFVNFLIYAIASFACMVFCCIYVVETKGKTLHDIQSLLERSSARGFNLS